MTSANLNKVANTDLADINQIIEQLQKLTQLDIQADWYSHREKTSHHKPQDYLQTIDLTDCAPVNLNDKGYIVFPKGKEVRWLVQKVVIPQSLAGYSVENLTLRLVLTWWAEDAQIFINGELVQAGDLFDSSARVLISSQVQPETEYVIAIRLVSPGHDIGALMRSHLLYEHQNTPEAIDPGWFSKELTVLSKYLTQFEPKKLNILAQELAAIEWNLVSDRPKFDACLNKIRQNLLPLASKLKKRKFNLLGHAHLDMAWLWTTEETYQVAERTFRSVLNLQQEYPDLTFCHTSPALYEWMEQNRPELFAQIQNATQTNKWEALGGMWIEPEVNIISGESIIRQCLYGQQYYQAKFGRQTQVAWLPDSFGFPWQLPQLLKQCGIDYFVTGKLHWNDTNKFEHGYFWWQSPDGTKLLTLMAPPNITGVMDTNPVTMTNYAINWETQTDSNDIFWLPGVGDHGGGPTRDMLAVADKWQRSPFFPEIKFSTATDYLDQISTSNENQSHNIPIHNSELYLELHRGCYTTHADQKKFNRQSENLLYQAELFATIADIVKPNPDLDQLWRDQIETAWKKVLFNQFHDILPGTSIPEVFTEANPEWQGAISLAKQVLQESLQAIASGIKLPNSPHPEAKAIVVFNALNWQRSQLVSSKISGNYQVYDLNNNLLPSQLAQNGQIQFLAEDIPSVGYRVYWLVPSQVAPDLANQKSENFTLTNQYLKVTVNPDTGDLDSIYDQVSQREILGAPGNQLQAFTDQGQYWDAWNIDPDYEQKQLPSAKLISIQWLSNNSLQQSIRVIRLIGSSEFRQDYILEQHSPMLKIATQVDWQETHVLVKAAFPLSIESEFSTSETACGAIARQTQPETPEDQAKWEVAALKWVDLTDSTQNYGVSLLNDCKYGYDFKPNQIRISLLRSPVWPDPGSDRGKHQFTYAIYPHQGSWQEARTVHHSYELNIPLQVVEINANQADQAKSLSAERSLLNWSAKNLILMALKKDAHNQLVLRCYESFGNHANLNLEGDLNFQVTDELNCLEENQGFDLNLNIQPWQVKNFRLSQSA